MSYIEQFKSGAIRDKQDGKLRYDLIPAGPLGRLAAVYTRGAAKYGDRNYEKGIPVMRCYASLMRHLQNWLQRKPGVEATDDDMAQVVWNAFAIMFYQDKGRGDLDDRPFYTLLETGKWMPASEPKAALERWLRNADLKPVGKKRIYISGPMRGYVNHNFELFDEAKFTLIKEGWDVISPADMDRLDTTEYPTRREQQTAYADRDIAAIKTCDGICCLPHWMDSVGAVAEIKYAQWIGIKEFFFYSPRFNIVEPYTIKDYKRVR
jgi:hypothetical protein